MQRENSGCCKKSFIAFIITVVMSFAYAYANADLYSGWLWPVPNNYRSLSRGFTSSHQGLDIIVSNQPVYASKDGTVAITFTGCKNYNALSTGTACKDMGCTPNVSNEYTNIQVGHHCNYGYGNGIILRHSDGSYSCYAHLSSVNVTANQSVKQGQLIGYSGSSGNSSGPHLHFSIASSAKDVYYNTLTYINNNVDQVSYIYVADTVAPSISNIQVSNVTNSGYTVTCTVSDNVGVTQVLFPSWTLKKDASGNEQDDIGEWKGVNVNSGANESRTVSFTVKSSEHNNETGTYRTHIYAYDAAGNTTCVAAPDVTVPEPGYTLSVASYLNGAKTNGAECGTFDVFINGTKVKEDIDSYSSVFSDPVTYTINDIRSADGKIYKGNQVEWTGTISGENREIGLYYETCAGLNIRFMLDGVESTSCEGYAVFDMSINGQATDENLTSYSEVFEDSSVYYEISSIICEDGKVFVDYPEDQPTSGTISQKVRSITLNFISEYEPSEDWQVMTVLPEAYDPDKCEIQYKNQYRSAGRTSPGTDWTFLEVESVQYEADGGTYTSATPLSTSETRKQVDHYYFHYCGDELDLANSTNWSNSKNKPLPNYHVRRDFDNVHIYQTFSDDGRAVYWLKLNGTNWDAYCPSYDASHTGSTMWYEEYVYQNYKPYQINTYVKESDWTMQLDPQATSVMYRIRLRQYKMEFDPMGGTMEEQVKHLLKYHEEDFMMLSSFLPQRTGFVFQGWNTAADGSGETYLPDELFTENHDQNFYAIWVQKSKLILPAGLIAIEEEAFAGSQAVNVFVPEGCMRIGSKAFQDCTSMEEIHIPGTTTDIALNAFDGCTNLTIYAPINSEAIRVAKYNDIPYVIE